MLLMLTGYGRTRYPRPPAPVPLDEVPLPTEPDDDGAPEPVTPTTPAEPAH